MPENNTKRELPRVIHPQLKPGQAPAVPPPPQLTPELRLKVLKATAVNQAMFEVVQEQRGEIVRRARAKLLALGIEVAENEVELK